MAFKALLIFRMTLQMPPPRKSSGLVVSSDQISASFSFQVESAEFRFWTTQLSISMVLISFLWYIYIDIYS